jgi:hypothetical protein
LNAGGAAPQSSGGLLSKAWDFAGTPQGMNLVGNLAQGMMGGAAAEEQKELLSRKLDADIANNHWQQDQINRQVANLNSPVIHVDPNSPYAQAIRDAAAAAGKQVVDFGLNPEAQLKSPTGIFKTNQQQGAVA